MPKPSNNEKLTDSAAIKIEKVTQLILRNQSFLKKNHANELVEIVKAEFGLEARMANAYIAAAKSNIKAIAKKNTAKVFNRAILDRQYLIDRLKDKDPKTALAAMIDREKLFGMYVENVHHSGKIDFTNVDKSKMTDEQIKAVRQMIRNKESEEKIEQYLKMIGVL